MYNIDGVLHAETPDDLAYLMQYAAGGGNQPRRDDLALDAGLAYASSLLPGAGSQTDFSVIGVDAPDGPAKTPLGYGTSGAKSAAQKKAANAMSKLREFHKAYEEAIDPALDSATAAIGKGARGGAKLVGLSPSAAGKTGRMAMQALGHPVLRTAMKYAPVVGGAATAADLVLGDESMANKGMDIALAGAGGFLGSAVPVVGTVLGATGGKMLSDGIQYIVGGGQTPEERAREEALSLLRGMA